MSDPKPAPLAPLDLILPCPFCGGKADLCKDEPLSLIECEDCRAAGGRSPYDKKAIAKWNSRVAPEVPPHQIRDRSGDLMEIIERWIDQADDALDTFMGCTYPEAEALREGSRARGKWLRSLRDTCQRVLANTKSEPLERDPFFKPPSKPIGQEGSNG